MSLDINNNNSYLYKNAVQGKKDDEKNKSKNSDEQNKKDSNSENEQRGDNLSHKSAQASSLELMGAQNALMVNKESIVHTGKASVQTSNYDKVKEPSQTRQLDINSNLSDLDDKALLEFEKLEKEKNKKKKESAKENQVENNKTADEPDILAKAGDYQNYGIIRNSDGTFSIKNNPFGKFTKTTIEDYINKYILPASSETWVNGYSQIYAVNGQKLFLVKVTTKDGTKAFRGSIHEDGIKYTIFYGVTSDGKPDGNNVIKKIKVITSF